MDDKEDIPDDQKIAIVGIGCRFADGIDTVGKLWDVLVEGRDCTSPHPANRYDVPYYLCPGEKLPGKMYNLQGGFVTQDLYQFDRNFFNMSPEEAQHLDPNTRFLLEVTWEALEDAGIPLSSVNTQTGVYIGGMSSSEYRSLINIPEHNIGPYTHAGNTPCTVSNRISYEFDFRGPSLALDTSCSSSLYTIYLACEALKHNQCEMAVTGGGNMMILPQTTIGLCQAEMLSPDGKSKSFDKSAAGYSRGEGFGVLVLKTLEKALSDNDRIYAVIRGGALNNDGRTTSITEPSADAQLKLLESACSHAKVSPKDITYSEAHATGNPVGDQTEVSVLGEFFGQSRLPEQPPLHVGSVKTNIGHTESAAGVASMIKTALCLKYQIIPRVVHFDLPDPSIDLDKLNLCVPTSTTLWPTEQPKIASCSSLGYSGSNACMIVEASPAAPIPQESITDAETRKPTLLLLSAATKEGLWQRLRDWLSFLQSEDVQAKDTTFRAALYTAALRSQHHKCRISFVVTSVEDAIELIQLKLSDGDVRARSVEGVARPLDTSGIAFVFSGMGTQWWGMARELMHKEPVFASVIKRISKLLKLCGTKWSLVKMLSKEEDTDAINSTEIAQPSVFAVQIGLVELWQLRGVVPDVIVGHGVGEVAAAYCAGLLSMENAVSLIYNRGRQLRKTSGSGTAVAVLHPVAEVLKTMQSKGYDQMLDIAAINSPNQVVISGDSSSLTELMTEFKTANIRCVELHVNNAFHSRQEDCLENIFKQKVSKFLKPKNVIEDSSNIPIPMISSVTGRYLTREEANSPEYWWTNIRQQVLFKSAVENLFQDGFQVFVEIGTHPVLSPAVKETVGNIRGSAVKPITAGSLVRPQDISKPAEDIVRLYLNHIQLFVSGVSCQFESYFDDNCMAVVSIPKYPWQREQCLAITQGTLGGLHFPVKHHPLLGGQQVMYTNLTSSTKWWKSKITKTSVPWLNDPAIVGVVIMPAAAYIEMSLAAARVIFPKVSPIVLCNVHLQETMYIPEDEGLLETTVEEITPERLQTTVRSHDLQEKTWTQHMEADIMNQVPVAHGGTLNVDIITKRCNVAIPIDTILAHKERTSLTYRASFQKTAEASVNYACSEILSYCEAPDVTFREFERYIFHPALLNSCFQSYGLLLAYKFKMKAEKTGTLVQAFRHVPSKIQNISLFSDVPRRLIVHLAIHDDGDGVLYCNIAIADADTRNIICEIQRLQFENFKVDTELGPRVWGTDWVNVSSVERIMENRRCLIFPDKARLSNTVANQLSASGVSTVILTETANPKHTIQQYFDDDIQHFTDILVILPLDMHDALSTLHPSCGITLKEFRKIQEQFPLFCMSLMLEVAELKIESRPRLIFVTVGAHAVISGESVNPFMSLIHSLVMTYMYEEPTLHAVSVDLPLEADAEEKSSIIHKAFLNLPDDENMVAYRKLNRLTHAISEMSLFAPRVRFDSVAEFRVKMCNKSWIITQDNGTARLSVKSATTDNSSTMADESIYVDIQAFYINAVEDDFIDVDQSESVHQDKLITIYAGVKQNDTPAPSKVVGLTDGTISSTISFSSEPSITDFAEIPFGIDCSEAVYYVNEYLPAQLYFHDLFPVTATTKILYATDDQVPLQMLSFPLVAYAKGVKMTVVSVQKKCDLSKISSFQENQNCNVINIENINNIDNSTVDLLIVPMASATLQNKISKILPKLRPSGTVLYLFNGDEKQPVIIPPKSAMRFMTFSTSLSRAFRGQTPRNILDGIKDIFDMVKQAKCLPKPTGIPHMRTLSTIPLVNATVPKSIVIAVDEEKTELPFELHNDIWVADKAASYLVTGGTSGLGLSLVKWLVSRGAIYIYVVSSGAPGEEAQQFFAVEKVAHIEHFKADVSDSNQIERILTSINVSNSPPLVGIFHFAAQYCDEFMENTNIDTWHSVMETTAYGALLLHQLTQKLEVSLRHFVVSSSLVSMVGNAGHANYCAATNFLNGLCHFRHHLGLPATSMCIGFNNSVGCATSHNLVKAGEERGETSLSLEDVLGAFNVAMRTGTPLIGYGCPLVARQNIQNRPYFVRHHFSEKQGKFSLLKRIIGNSDTLLVQSSGVFRQTLLEKSKPESKLLISKMLCNILSTQLGIPEMHTIDTGASLLSLGLDSLMATNVSEAIYDDLELAVNPSEIIKENASIMSLQLQILNQITNVSNDDIEYQNLRYKQNTTKPCIVEGPCLDNSYLTMVCFPPTGGGASFFTSWASYVAKYGIHLLMIQLPGWEGREIEKPLQSLQDIVQTLTDALVPRLEDNKFVFFGHSFGCLIAFETALHLQQHNLNPIHIFISSWYAPTLPYPHPGEVQNVNEENFRSLQKVLETEKSNFKSTIKEHGFNLSFVDDSFLNNSSIFLRMLPAIEVTFHMVKDYHFESRVTIPCGMTVFGGKDDPFLSPRLLNDWKRQIAQSSHFHKIIFEGKHMYIRSNTNALLKEVTNVLKKYSKKK